MAKIITIVGTSGSGKTSATPKIKNNLIALDYEVKDLIEPGPLRKIAKWYRQNQPDNHESQARIFAADRTILYDTDIKPNLDKENLLFLQTRGFPDSVVYQSILGNVPLEELQNINKNIPFSDLYIALVVDGTTGYKRALDRYNKTGEPITASEQPQKIEKYKKAYESLQNIFPNYHVVDTTNKNIDEVVSSCMELITDYVIKN